MEKASDVYNKLKLRFVGKMETSSKPKTEEKEQQDNGKDTQNTGKGSCFQSVSRYLECFLWFCYTGCGSSMVIINMLLPFGAFIKAHYITVSAYILSNKP